jgi:hypothetical protein
MHPPYVAGCPLPDLRRLSSHTPFLQVFAHGDARSEPSADAEDRPVLDHVELVATAALALDIVDREGPVPDHARECDALVGAELETVAADSLPGKSLPTPKPPMSPRRKSSWPGAIA